MFGFLNSKDKKILNFCRSKIDEYLLHMMNNTQLNSVIRRNESAKNDIEDRLGSAILEHYSVSLLAWLGKDGDKLQTLIVGGYSKHIKDLINECANFSPTDQDRIQEEFERDLGQVKDLDDKKRARIAKFLIDMSKEKCREWFVWHLANLYGASLAEQVSIGAELLTILKSVWDDSSQIVSMYLS